MQAGCISPWCFERRGGGRRWRGRLSRETSRSALRLSCFGERSGGSTCSLPAGSRRRPPAAPWAALGWNRCACLGLACCVLSFLGRPGSERLRTSLSCRVGSKSCQMCVLAAALCPSRVPAEGTEAEALPVAPLQHLFPGPVMARVYMWQKRPLSFSLTQSGRERQRWILKQEQQKRCFLE